MSACSSTTFVYNRLDFLLPWYLERYVDLDREQARNLDAQLEPLLQWHRREELPRYLSLIGALEESLDEPVDAAVVAGVSDSVNEAWLRIRAPMLDELLMLAGDLHEEQLDELFASLERRQRKYERKYLNRSIDEYRRDAAESLRDSLEDYLGRLDAQQRRLVSEAAAQLRRADEAWLRERARFIDALRAERERREGWADRIRELVQGWEASLDETTAVLYAHNTAVLQEAVAAVLQSRSAKQDQRLRRRLGALREDIELLIAQGKKDAA